MLHVLTLDDQAIASILTYIRNGFGNKASGITPSEVAAIRNQKK